jgi:hypothetical protein
MAICLPARLRFFFFFFFPQVQKDSTLFPRATNGRQSWPLTLQFWPLHFCIRCQVNIITVLVCQVMESFDQPGSSVFLGGENCCTGLFFFFFYSPFFSFFFSRFFFFFFFFFFSFPHPISRGPSKQSLGYILRSRPMTHIQMFLQRDVARETVARLGDEGLVQFRDLNPNTRCVNFFFFFFSCLLFFLFFLGGFANLNPSLLTRRYSPVRCFQPYTLPKRSSLCALTLPPIHHPLLRLQCFPPDLCERGEAVR